MSKVILVTVADDRSGRKDGAYGKTQDYIEKVFKAHPEFGITDFLMWKWDDIVASRYYERYKEQLDITNAELSGRLYKPLLIKEGLSKIEKGDFLIYNDTSPELWNGVNQLDWDKYSAKTITDLCVKNGGILTAHAEFNIDEDGIYRHIGWPDNTYQGAYNANVPGRHTHEPFTSEKCKKVMDPKGRYTHCLQHASGLVVLQKNKKSIKFIEDWIRYNIIYDCHTAEPGIPHRTDQSISGILINKLGNKLIRCLVGNNQDTVINPYNLLSSCQDGAEYKFVDSIQPMPKMWVKFVPIFEADVGYEVNRWRLRNRD